MKKGLVVVVCFVLLASVCGLCLAEDSQKAKDEETGMMKGGMKGHMDKMGQDETMGKKKMTMPMPMMPMMMMVRAMVATNDGGVVVLVGNKLLKYDKNLQLKNEAEIKIDKEAMRKMMSSKAEECPKNKSKEKEHEHKVDEK